MKAHSVLHENGSTPGFACGAQLLLDEGNFGRGGTLGLAGGKRGLGGGVELESHIPAGNKARVIMRETLTRWHWGIRGMGGRAWEGVVLGPQNIITCPGREKKA